MTNFVKDILKKAEKLKGCKLSVGDTIELPDRVITITKKMLYEIRN